MNEVCYLVFATDGITIVHSTEDIALPEKLRDFPLMKVNEELCEVSLTDLVVRSKHVRDMLYTNIMEAIKTCSMAGPVRLVFPSWDVMLIYVDASPEAKEKYWDPEQLVSSFLGLHGPEMIL